MRYIEISCSFLKSLLSSELAVISPQATSIDRVVRVAAFGVSSTANDAPEAVGSRTGTRARLSRSGRSGTKQSVESVAKALSGGSGTRLSVESEANCTSACREMTWETPSLTHDVAQDEVEFAPQMLFRIRPERRGEVVPDST